MGETWLDANLLPLHEFTYSFDAAGQLLAAGDDAAEYEYAYDSLGRATEISQTFAALAAPVVFAQSYDLAGCRTQLAAAIGPTADFVNDYEYDLLGRLTRLEQHGIAGGAAVAEKRVDFAYNARSQFAQITRYAALAGAANDEVFATRYAYDGYARLASLSHVADGVELAGYAYTWDKADRITRIDYASLVAGASSSTFTYDNGSQLTAADHTDQTDEAYEYDLNGNRITANGASYTTGANNQLLSDGVFNYTYDLEGNRLTRTRVSAAPADDHLVEYTWDHRNRLTAVTFKNNSGTVTKRVENDYDLYQRWIGQRLDADGDGDMDSSRSFVYDEFQIVLAFADPDGPGPAGSSLTNRYLWGPAVDQLLADELVDASPGQAADILWAATDHLNTVRDQLTFDPAGNSGSGHTTIANHRDYDSFGNVVSEANAAVDSLFGYTARPFDEQTGQQNNLNRWYDAVTGRWLSEDPIGFAAGDGNLARSVVNNPLTATDPWGLEVMEMFASDPPVPDRPRVHTVNEPTWFYYDRKAKECARVRSPTFSDVIGGIYYGTMAGFTTAFAKVPSAVEEAGRDTRAQLADTIDNSDSFVQRTVARGLYLWSVPAEGIAQVSAKGSLVTSVVAPATVLPGGSVLTEPVVVKTMGAFGTVAGVHGLSTSIVDGTITPSSAALNAAEIAGGWLTLRQPLPPNNPIPRTFARVIPGTHADAKYLGVTEYVFVTSASSLRGLAPKQLARRLEIPEGESFLVVEFCLGDLTGVATPIRYSNPAFVGRGLTSGGLPVFIVPNRPIPANAKRRIIE